MMTAGCDETVHAARRDAAAGRSHSALTLVEVLVTVAILLVLMSLVVVATRTVQASARRSRAAAQMQMLASAMERYSQAWPVWRDAAGAPVADRAWPHWSAWAAFPDPPFSYASPKVGVGVGLVNAWERHPSDDDDPSAPPPFDGRRDVFESSACLAYGLATPALGKTLIEDAQEVFPVASDLRNEYPFLGVSAPLLRRVVDPWGLPVRYLWVVRDGDASSASGWRAITTADPTGPTDLNVDPFYARAQAFVIESAGPDGRFGNIWKRSATAQEVTDAADNPSVRP